MAKGLMDGCLAHKKTLACVYAKSKATMEKLDELKAWKLCHEKKLKLSEQIHGDLEKEVELLKEALKDKEENLRQAKVEAIHEYWDSDALLSKLGTFFADDFDDCLRQVKDFYPDLNLAHISLDAEGQTSAQLADSEGTKELFSEDPGNGEVQKDNGVEKGIVQQPLAPEPEDKGDNPTTQEQ